MPINKVGSKGIADGSIATADLNDGLVTSAKLQNGAVTNVKLTNTAFTLSGTSVSLGGSTSIPNKFVDWQSVIVADGSTGTTGVSGRGYFINTTSAAHIFTLPVSATRGDTIAIKDYAGTFATNNLTINRNGHNIQGVANNSLISTNRASVVLVYVDVTRGWEFVEESNVATLGQVLFISATGGTITTSGNFKIHSFTGDGCFVVSQVGNSPVAPTGGPANVDYLVVAGGGGGGNLNDRAGGGGAGGYRTTFPSPACNAGSFPITATTYPITVGGGGAGGTFPGFTFSTSGNPSIFSSITSTGGGRGGNRTNCSGVANPGDPGGSGGGGSGPGTNPAGPNTTGGTGNTPPVSPSQGNPGGIGQHVYGSWAGGGGGGGAGGAGNDSSQSSPTASAGGSGSTNSISGSPVTYAGGGGGTQVGATTPSGAAGPGGGGAGNNGGGANPGTVNTGGGGGGGYSSPGTPTVSGGAGGKGIVIIRYKFQ